MKITTMTMLAAIAASVTATVGIPATAQADPPPPCADGQVQVSNGGHYSASGHREVVLLFSLPPGAKACTLTGYPGVDTGAGGPLLHADRTLNGFMGGIRPDPDALPTVTLSATQPADAVVEGVAIDRNNPGRDTPCPTYTELLVTPPDTTEAVSVSVRIDTCELQVHPMGSSW